MLLSKFKFLSTLSVLTIVSSNLMLTACQTNPVSLDNKTKTVINSNLQKISLEGGQELSIVIPNNWQLEPGNDDRYIVKNIDNENSSISLLTYDMYEDIEPNWSYRKVNYLANKTKQNLRTKPRFKDIQLISPIVVNKIEGGKGFYYSVQIKPTVDERPTYTVMGALDKGNNFIDVVAKANSESDFKDIVNIINSIQFE